MSTGQPALPVALTMGEPAGIGGEITLKVWRDREARKVPPFVVLDDAARLTGLADRLGWTVPVVEVARAADAMAAFARGLPVLHRPLGAASRPGVPDQATAAAVIASIKEAVGLCLADKAAGVATNPIHKETLARTGFAHEGHTQYVAELCAPAVGHKVHPVMMLLNDHLKVALATIHIPVKDVPAKLTMAGLVETARTVLEALQSDFGIAAPRLAVTGLNPHAGEGGLMGEEERTTITPAIEVLRVQGWTVTGPHAADSLFHDEARSRYDAVLCMYHDQGLIPLKTLDFDEGVNLTLGLPIVRTSPDHGTAFDIAGTGRASPASLAAALRLCARLSASRRRTRKR